MFDSDSVMTNNFVITSVANSLKKIHRIANILNEFTSKYDENTDDYFAMLFQKYTASSFKKIYHPDRIQ